jgi:glycosyltransferase involved in cell wall biosynthesis
MYGVMLQRKLKVPVITTVHSDPSLDYLGRPAADRVYGAINRRAIRSISWHECVSEELRETLVLSGVRRESTFLIHNSVAAEAGQIPVPRSEWRRMRNLGTDENTVVFGTAARFSPVKDISTLISAFSEAVKNAPDARLVIAGDGEEDAKLKLLAAKLCPPGTVIFTGWLEDTASFYNAIDVNVLTSLTEGFPYAIPEGGIMECATIATLVGSIPQILTDGEEGLLFEPGDVGALSRHMEVLIKDPALRERLGRAICLKIRSEYSFDSMIRRQLEIYYAVLSS